MKRSKDHIHLYIGTACQFKEAKTGNMFTRPLSGGDIDHWIHEGHYEFIKPALRPLSDISWDEMGTIADLYSGMIPDTYQAHRMCEAQGTKYLIDRGFDLFGLLESGDAIDRSTL